METVRGIVDHDTIRLVTPLSLPQGAEIEFEPRMVGSADDAPPLGCPAEKLADILLRSYDTGDTDLAARVDELDP
jgi:hypothetical protein